MKKEIKLSRIHCAGCASSLEDKLKEVEGVSSLSIDFLKKTVTFEADSKEISDVTERVEEAIRKFDGSIKIIDTSAEEKERKREKIEMGLNIARPIVSAALAAVAYFVPITWLKITLFLLAYICVACTVLYAAVYNIFHGKMLDECFLMSVATIGALCIQEWVEAVAVMLLYNVGELLQNAAVDKSRKRVRSLLSIKAEYANKVEDEQEQIVTLDMLAVGDTIRIKPGEKVPVDCTIISGHSYLNTSAITGESKELFVNDGVKILSGCINGQGVLLCRVDHTEEDSTATKIIDMVENASKSKAPAEKFVTKFAKIYTPIVVGAAVLVAVVPWLCGQSFSYWLDAALKLLVISCPCALVISVPLSYFAGIGALARNGVLVKGATYIEKLAEIDTVIFDKTGTLTHGEFEVESIHSVRSSSNEEVLELIAYAESFSNHRIAKSIVKEYGKQVNTAWVEDYSELPGLGVSATLFGEACLVGNEELLRQNGIKFKTAKEVGTVVYLAKNGKFLGYVVVADKIKEESYTIAAALKAAGISTVGMFTGDNQAVADSVAYKLGFNFYRAGLMPSGKVSELQQLSKQGKKVAFVGDGINDAPSLAASDVGISMGTVGSDAAIEASDVVLVKDQPQKIIDALESSRKTKKIVIENITVILIVKLAVMVLSLLGLAQMWMAIFADVGICLITILNSLRAMKYKPRGATKRAKTLAKA